MYNQVPGYDGWEYKEYGYNRYKTVVLYYRDGIITVLKRWSKHFSEDKDEKTHYTTLAQAVQAHMQDERVLRADRMAKQKASPDSLATAG